MADDTARMPQGLSSTPSLSKTCEECGSTFVAQRKSARFCSGTCRLRAWERVNSDQVLERKRETARRSRAADPERSRAAVRRYEAAHPEKVAEWKERRREKAAAARQPKPPRTGPLRGRKDRKHGSDWRTAYAEFWDAQGGCCYLCGDPLDLTKPQCIVFDHNHACCPANKSCKICRRGLACNRCNRAIGYALDDPARLRRMADALDAANALVLERMTTRDVQEGLF